MDTIKKLIFCRVCKSKKLHKVFDFGPTPLANEFLSSELLDKPESYYPLQVLFCQTCSMLQLAHVVNPRLLFDKYVYVSSTSPVFVKHFEDFASDITQRFNLKKDDLVIDIGSNDGILLKPYKKRNINILGIEPAKQIAKIASNEKVQTIAEYFSLRLAKRISKQYGKARVVTATNVFAHIDDLDDVISGVSELLTDDGIFVIEAPYLIDFIQKSYFDLVYHEHLSYWSVRTLITLFKRFNMQVFDVQKVAVHGGSIRVFVQKDKKVHKLRQSVRKFLSAEKRMNLEHRETYISYNKKVLNNKIRLLTLLWRLKKGGSSIAAYGAPAKGNTLLNYFSIGTELLDYVVDDSRFKQNLFTPGKHIAVVSQQEIYKRRPDYMIILAWNFAESIIEAHSKYTKLGGHFISPVPRPQII